MPPSDNADVANGPKANVNKRRLISVAILIAFVAGVWFWPRYRTPGCDAAETTSLVIKILREQLKIPGNLKLHDIVVKQGNWFSSNRKCETAVEGVEDLAKGHNIYVGYDVSATSDTHRVFVVARILPY